ncbi:hypothetical protein OCV69_05600 [Alitiscatomonas aceti]|uniref:Uncharacterized protein n=1 Tax=Alitiscatomonas aceti TaxID=2981724 RepID=A0ABT2UXR5_9FIRM|nr:hypothetical protein [Alitiscatomonas aceti]
MFDRKFLSNKKALRAESHCGGMEFRRKCDPPQAENPARAEFFPVSWKSAPWAEMSIQEEML